MLNGLAIMIVEDEPFDAWDLILAIEDAAGNPIGPMGSVAHALTLLEQGTIAAAILDASFLDHDVTPIAVRLIEKDVPFVVLSRPGVRTELAALHPDLPVVMKPVRPLDVLRILLERIHRKLGAVALSPRSAPA